jgi:hypothetical protein
MRTAKESSVVVAARLETDGEGAFGQNVSREKKGTYEDQRDMFRMGKIQEMRVCALRSRRRVMPGGDALLTLLASEISVSCPSSAFR